jgi:hypothetical protein
MFWGKKQESYAMSSIANLEREGHSNLLAQKLSLNSKDEPTIDNENSLSSKYNNKELIPESVKFWQAGYGLVEYDDGFPERAPFGFTLHYHGNHKWYQGLAVGLEIFKLDDDLLNMYLPIIDLMWLPGISFVKEDYGAYLYAGAGASLALMTPVKVGVDFYVKNIGLGISYKLYNPLGNIFYNEQTETANLIWFNLGYVSHSD